MIDPAVASVVAGASLAGAWVAGAMLPWPGLHDLLVPGALWSLPHGSRAVALTFDDGPDPSNTPRLLDMLRAAGARATFFVLGERARSHPALIERIVAEGHGLGNHSWRHCSMPRLGARRMAIEIDGCQEVLGAITGRAPRIIRPPFGRRDLRFYRAARRRSLTPVMWSLDSLDWVADPQRVGQRLTAVDAGDIVLLHDHRSARIGEALEALLERLALEGLATLALGG